MPPANTPPSTPSTQLTPSLTVDAGNNPQAVVLVLHGGRDHSNAAVKANQLAVLRMIPFAHRITERSAGKVAVARLRYAVRGWNGRGGSPAPVTDARWALQELQQRFPGLPLGVVGHSMGGRTALRVGGHPGVQGVVGLAPWLPDGEPADQLTGRKVLLVHGSADRMTSAAATARFAARLQRLNVDVSTVQISGEKHSMLHQPKLWHELTAQFIVSVVLPGYAPSGWPDAPNFLPEVLEGRASITC